MNELTQEQQEAVEKCIKAFQELYNAAKEFVGKIIEAIKPFVKWLTKILGPIYRKIRYYKKYNIIYNRTKSKRIRKKQISLMRKRVFV